VGDEKLIQIRILTNDPILIIETVKELKKHFPTAKFTGIRENTRNRERFKGEYLKYRGYVIVTIPLEKPREINTIPGCFGHYAKPLEGLECLSCPLRDLCWEASTS